MKDTHGEDPSALRAESEHELDEERPSGERCDHALTCRSCADQFREMDGLKVRVQVQDEQLADFREQAREREAG